LVVHLEETFFTGKTANDLFIEINFDRSDQLSNQFVFRMLQLKGGA
jgi:hypothetical protein